MSKPFPFPVVKKDDGAFDNFMGEVLESAVDLHRVVAEFRLVNTPTASTAAGKPGMFSYDDDYLYLCVTNNTWKRVALSTW